MSDLITSAQDTFRSQCVEAFVGLQSLAHSLAERAREQRGQTAAEYMGILFIISAIIAAIVISNVDTFISGKVHDIVDAISKGKKAE